MKDNAKSKNYYSLYLRPMRDDDIREYIESLCEYKGDRSDIVRELVRDGIKYRSLQNKDVKSQTIPTEVVNKKIELKKVEVSDDDLENRLDDF